MTLRPDTLSDQDTLKVLDAVDAGLSYRAIGKHYGKTKSAIAGLVMRCNASARCACINPENKDGAGWTA